MSRFNYKNKNLCLITIISILIIVFFGKSINVKAFNDNSNIEDVLEENLKELNEEKLLSYFNIVENAYENGEDTKEYISGIKLKELIEKKEISLILYSNKMFDFQLITKDNKIFYLNRESFSKIDPDYYNVNVYKNHEYYNQLLEGLGENVISINHLNSEVKKIEKEGSSLLPSSVSDNINNVLGVVFSILFNPISIVLIAGFILVKYSEKKTVGMGKKTKVPVEEDIDVELSQIKGIDETVKDMEFIINFLKNPKEYEEMGVRNPKGIIFHGPPGTGKTLTAKAIAGEAGVPFYSVSGSEFIEMYVGVGAKRVRELYSEARKNAPCIVFIDEIDAVGGKRSASSNNGAQEQNQTINQLLTELDGFDGGEGIITIAATNRLDMLDDALIRPGRFDKHIAIPLPDRNGRYEILKIHSENKKLAEDVDLKEVASMTTNFSGAALESLMNEAAFIAVNNNKKALDMEDIELAFFRQVMKGDIKENQSLRDKQELELVAWHEAGHALLTKLLTNDEVPKVTILSSTSGAGGVTFTNPEENSLHSKKYIENRVKIMYGGRAAEEIFFGDTDKVTTGASNDIQQATKMIYQYISSFGMSDKYGMVDINVFNSPELVLNEVVNISDKLYSKSLSVLLENKGLLSEIAEALLEKETLTNDELDEIISNNKK